MKTRQKRKGQTLAEFAITLPILLLLVFGVIEFGRVFQAWVTLQNSARAAARYASTGRYNEAKYVINENLETDPGSVVQCSMGDDRGTPTTLTVPGETVQIYTGEEGLFATWYDGEDCDPRRIDHQDMRKDIARILSIVDEARRGAAGLALGPDPLANVDTQAEVRDFLFEQWERPVPGGGQYNFHEGADQPSYFDVMICSSRGTRNDFSNSYYDGVPTRFFTALDKADFNSIKVNGLSTGVDTKNIERVPLCVMNEIPPAGNGSIQNGGVPWIDAGGPGDAVTIVVTFNHPLVTPLGLAPYIPLQARRAAVNEAFRAADATGALQGGAAITGSRNIPPQAVLKITNQNVEQPDNLIPIQESDLDPATGGYPVLINGSESYDQDGPNGKPVTYIYELVMADGSRLELGNFSYTADPLEAEAPNPNTPVAGKTPEGRFIFAPGTHTVDLTVIDNEGASNRTSIIFTIKLPEPPEEPSEPPPPSPTNTEIPPFTCDRLSATDLSFFNNRVWIQIHNTNFKSTTLERVTFDWNTLPEFPNMYVSGMSLNGVLHWRGQDFNPATDSFDDVPNPATIFQEADRTVPGEDTVTWEGVFNNGPAPIHDVANNIFWMEPHDFNGTVFTFDNPDSDQDCLIPLEIPAPTPVPGGGNNQPPTATWTPDCAGTDVDIRFESFETFGVVRLIVVNQRAAPSTMTDFNVNWVKRKSGMVLERVVVGGTNAADLTNGTLVWQAGAGQDSQPPTLAGSTAASASGREGTWLTNYSFPPNTTTNLWIKFGVTNSPPDTAFGMAPSDLNGTWFQITCGTPPSGPGQGGGAWYGDDGRITIFQEPTPFPTDTPRCSRGMPS